VACTRSKRGDRRQKESRQVGEKPGTREERAGRLDQVRIGTHHTCALSHTHAPSAALEISNQESALAVSISIKSTVSVADRPSSTREDGAAATLSRWLFPRGLLRIRQVRCGACRCAWVSPSGWMAGARRAPRASSKPPRRASSSTHSASPRPLRPGRATPGQSAVSSQQRAASQRRHGGSPANPPGGCHPLSGRATQRARW
jgi:hypothetical protein